jgi:hypothetical protein
MNPAEFQASFLTCMQALQTVTVGEVVAINGKQLRGSHDRYLGKHTIYMASAWATENGLVLGQAKVAEKLNEIMAIPQLLDLNGCIVTKYAMGCQRRIA